MALTQYTADTDIIETLGTNPEDRPTLTDDTFKAKFDENAANIKTFLNAMIAELASTASGKGASQIGIEDSASKITATTVEAALAEFATLISTVSGNLSTHTGETVFCISEIVRNASTSGVQTVSLPFLAKKIEIMSMIPNSKQWSHSVRIGNIVRAMYQHASAEVMFFEVNDIVLHDGTNVFRGLVQNVTETGFEINWTREGSPTGTAVVVISASTH